jgi:hypothetical protein
LISFFTPVASASGASSVSSLSWENDWNTQAEEYGPQRSRVNQISREIFQ